MRLFSLFLMYTIICRVFLAFPTAEDTYQIISETSFSLTNIYQQNNTFVLSKNLFKGESLLCSQHIIEMEITDDLNVYENIQVVFGVNSGSAIKLDEDILQGDNIDVRGYIFRKKYFRTNSLPHAYTSQASLLYLTIILRNSHSRPIIPMNFIINVIPFNSCSSYRHCPFNCLNGGTCDGKTGKCQCRRGFLDTDCSRVATSLALFKDYSHLPNEFSWQTRFYKTHKISFYYIPRSSLSQEGGYLYLDITSEMDLSEKGVGNLEIFYFNSPYKGKEDPLTVNSALIQQTFLLSQQQLAKGITIRLDYIDEDKEEYNDSLSEVDYIIGFYQYDNDSSVQEFEAYLYSKLYTMKTDLSNESSIYGQNPVITVLCAVLILLVIMLVVLIMCIQRRASLVETRREERINTKKKKKEEEDYAVLELIPAVLFSDQMKRDLKKQIEDEKEDPTCPVCLCEFDLGDYIRKTYCPHYFHADCLESWLKKQKNCPNCRNSLSPRSILNNNKSSPFISLEKQAQISLIPLEKQDNTSLHHQGGTYILQVNDYLQVNNTNNSPMSHTCRGQAPRLEGFKDASGNEGGILSHKMSKFGQRIMSSDSQINDESMNVNEEQGQNNNNQQKCVLSWRVDSGINFIQMQNDLQSQEDKITIQELTEQTVSDLANKVSQITKSLPRSPVKSRSSKHSINKKSEGIETEPQFKPNLPTINDASDMLGSKLYLSRIFKEEEEQKPEKSHDEQ